MIGNVRGGIGCIDREERRGLCVEIICPFVYSLFTCLFDLLDYLIPAGVVLYLSCLLDSWAWKRAWDSWGLG